ncbi:MAG: iron-sulfur cluster assembly protein [Caldiserica bacterium]|jgi:FeS assembly SUF system protein|nr:iron-sulfur cluster assembly protein [Caldisericota bacterium]MDH7563189.1 iron-sulfur cluster assembly protein [Caldisericota bacterium]
MPTKEDILTALKEVYDPEIPINIVDLGLIYDVQISNDNVHVKLTLTAPGCPLSEILSAEVRERLLKVEGIKEASVEVVWDPPWTPERINKEALEKLFDQRKIEP